MKFILVLILSVFGVPTYYCKELYSGYNTLKRSSQNEPELNLHPDSFGVNLKNIGDENVQDGPSDVESADNKGEITSLEGRKCGRMISKCDEDTDCCTGYCQATLGRCLFNPFHHSTKPAKCREIHNQCLYNYQCCSGVCDPVTGLCQNHLVTLHPPIFAITSSSCSPYKGPCQVNAHCCSKICDTKKGSCKKASTKKLDGKVIDFPILLNAAIAPQTKQTLESNPEEDEITESEQIVTKEIKKESSTRKDSFIIKHNEVYETSRLEKKNGELLSSSFLSSAKNPLEKSSINEQRVLEKLRDPGDDFGTSSLDQQKNIGGSSIIQRKFETISSYNQRNIGGSISSEQRLAASIPQKENKDGSLLVNRILKTSSSHNQNNIGGSLPGPSLHQQEKIEGSTLHQRNKSTSLNKEGSNEESSSSWQRQMLTPTTLQTNISGSPTTQQRIVPTTLQTNISESPSTQQRIVPTTLQTNISGSPSTQQRIVQTSSHQIGRSGTLSSKEKTTSSSQPELNATSTKLLEPEQVQFERVKPNIETASSLTNVTTTASPDMVETTPKSQESPQDATTKNCSLNGQKCLHNGDCCSSVCSHSSNSCTVSSSQSSSQESFQESSNETCLENMSTQ